MDEGEIPGAADTGKMPDTRASEAIAGDSFGLSLPEIEATGLETRMEQRMAKAKLFGREARIGRYVVESKLGQGGMGVVYRARDNELDRSVAIKLVGRAGDRERVLREARAMAQLAHPNVVHVYDVGEYEQQVFIAMELVPGQTLKEWFEGLGKGKHRGRRWPEVVGMMLQAGEGLLAAHRADLVHRDFKPANVLVAEDGRARVLDFGLAEPVADQAPNQSGPGDMPEANAATFDARGKRARLAGTPAYLAPELLDRGTYDARSDQFSFSVTFFEGLYGQRPFQGVTAIEIMHNIAEGRIAPPPQGVGIPRWLDRIVRRGLDPDPNRRWQSMDELMAACRRGLASRRRRPWIVGAVVVSLIFIVYSISRSDVCIGAGDAIAEVWTASAQSELQQALVASGAAYTEPLAQRVDEALTSEVEDWAEVAERTCEAHSTGNVTDEVYNLQVACLVRHRERIAALISVLTTTGGQTASQAFQAVLKLEPVRECEDVDRQLERSERLAKPDPAIADKVAAAESQLQRVHALHDAQVIDEGLELAGALEEEVQKFDYTPLMAEVSLGFGRLQTLAGVYAEAEQTLLKTVMLAEQANHDRIKVAALALLSKVMGEALSRHDEAMRWSSLAESTLRRRGEIPGLAWADVLNSRAAVEANRQDYQAEHDNYEQALAIVEQYYGQQHLAYSKMLGNYAASLKDLGELERALELYNQALKVASDALGDQHPELAVFLNNIGEVERKLGNLEDARAHLTQAGQLLADAGLDDRYGQVLNNIGTVFEELNQFDAALDAYRQALELWQKSRPQDFSVAMLEMNIGNILRLKQDVDGAIARHLSAIELLEVIGVGDSPPRALAYLNLGEAQIDAGDYPAAQTTLGRSLAVAEAAQEPILQADALTSLGRLAIVQKDCTEAIGKLQMAQSLYARDAYGTDAAKADILLAHALSARKKSDERASARALLTKALATLPPETQAAKGALALQRRMGEGTPPTLVCGEFVP